MASGINPRKVDQHFRVVLPPEIVKAMGLKQRNREDEYFVHFTLKPDGRIEMQRVRMTLDD